MNIPANDAFSLNDRSHRRRSNSINRSPPPPSKISFFTASPEKQRTRGASMSLKHRTTANGAASHSGSAVNGSGNGDARERDDEIAKGHPISPPIDWEIPRKVFHSSIGFFVIPLYTNHISASKVAIVLSAACTVIASVDFVRLRSPRFAAIYEKTLGFLMRESEKNKTNGVIWYLLGCIFVLALYPEDIAVVSILILSWCDTTASFFGRLYGSRTPPLPQSLPIPFTSARIPLPFARRKSVAGFLAGAFTGTLIVFGFWRYLAPLGALPASIPNAIIDITKGTPSSTSLVRLACVAAITGLLAGIAEAIDIGSLDDNLTLPIISGGIIYALFKTVNYIFS